MKAQYWICPDCGALVTPLHSHCGNCGRKVSAGTKALMLLSVGYIAASAVKYAVPASSGAKSTAPASLGVKSTAPASPRVKSTAPITVDKSTEREVKGNLYRTELSPCGHPAWVRGKDRPGLFKKTVICRKCPAGDNLRKVGVILA